MEKSGQGGGAPDTLGMLHARMKPPARFWAVRQLQGRLRGGTAGEREDGAGQGLGAGVRRSGCRAHTGEVA